MRKERARCQCQLRVKGHLAPEWSEWFEGLTLTWDECDNTILTGQLLDQAALYGVLNKLRDLGVPLSIVSCAFSRFER